MYSGKPILNSFSGEGDLVNISNNGITVEAKNPQAIAQGILKMYNLTQEERKIMGMNGKNYVLEHFTYEKLAKKLEELL